MESNTRLRAFVPDTGTNSPGIALSRTAWVRINRLRSDVGRSRFYLHKWGMASSAACERYAEEQNAGYVVLQCPIHGPPHEPHGVIVLDDEKIEWLLNICPEI